MRNMFERKAVKKVNRMVWRISTSNPAGEFVPSGGRQVKRTEPAELHESGFRASSIELSNGSVMSEAEMDTLPGELVDAFLKVSR